MQQTVDLTPAGRVISCAGSRTLSFPSLALLEFGLDLSTEPLSECVSCETLPYILSLSVRLAATLVPDWVLSRGDTRVPCPALSCPAPARLLSPTMSFLDGSWEPGPFSAARAGPTSQLAVLRAHPCWLMHNSEVCTLHL